MESRWLFLVVMVVVVVPTPCPALSPECHHADLVILNTEDTNLLPVFRPYREGNNYITQRSFMQPEEGFLGVSVKVTGTINTTSMFFKFQDREYCYPGNADWWWRVSIECRYVRLFENIVCSMNAGECYWSCTRKFPTGHDRPDIGVVAHGPSRWRLTAPTGECTVKGWNLVPPYRDSTCRPRPATTRRPSGNTSATTTTTTTDTSNYATATTTEDPTTAITTTNTTTSATTTPTTNTTTDTTTPTTETTSTTTSNSTTTTTITSTATVITTTTDTTTIRNSTTTKTTSDNSNTSITIITTYTTKIINTTFTRNPDKPVSA